MRRGEPDADGITKILLSDWVRGRIPFFVLPLSGLKSSTKRKERKGKEKAGQEAPIVEQNSKSIVQKDTFLPEGGRPPRMMG